MRASPACLLALRALLTGRQVLIACHWCRGNLRSDASLCAFTLQEPFAITYYWATRPGAFGTHMGQHWLPPWEFAVYLFLLYGFAIPFGALAMRACLARVKQWPWHRRAAPTRARCLTNEWRMQAFTSTRRQASGYSTSSRRPGRWCRGPTHRLPARPDYHLIHERRRSKPASARHLLQEARSLLRARAKVIGGAL